MKGIVLAGGKGTRLYPATLPIVKQLLPVYDKPMIYYPLSVLFLAGIKDILIISTPVDIDRFKMLFGDGSQLGVKFSYLVQEEPLGLAHAFVLGEEFVNNEPVCMILGDNLLYGDRLTHSLKESVKIVETENKAVIFGYYVNNPSQYGIVEFDKNGNVLSIEEKPKNPKSNWAVIGLYFYPGNVVEKAKQLKPSWRNELEITDLNKLYLQERNLKMRVLGRGYAWLDTGTHKDLLEASNFVKIIEERQGLKIGCLEEIAYRNGWLNKKGLEREIQKYAKSSYGEYLKTMFLNND
jgi:glucose-1-phosphate thymidylyltransferase